MVDAASHPNIELLAYSEVEGWAAIGNFEVKVQKALRGCEQVHRLRHCARNAASPALPQDLMKGWGSAAPSTCLSCRRSGKVYH